MYKLSRFNITLEKENSVIIYNPITKMIVELTGEKSIGYEEYINKQRVDKRLINILTSYQMIVDADLDENEKIKAISMMNRFNTQKLTLVVAPTLECNMQCPYCFQKSTSKSVMSKEILSELVRFAKHRSQNVADFNVVWYGGEPLLELEKIQELTMKFKSNCGPITKYGATIITNGYLLDKHNAKILKQLDVKSAQITIDGPRVCHNKRRVGPETRSSYDVILRNIKEAVEYLDIIVRVNVDKNNASYIQELFSELEDFNLKDKVSIYVAKVFDLYGDCKIDCITTNEFVQHKYNFMSEGLKRGFKKSYSIENFIPEICSAATRNSYVIDPKGNIYKCYNHIGIEEEKIGDIIQGPKINKNLIKWLNYSYGADKCKECKMTLICGGGCPDSVFNKRDQSCENRELEFLKVLDLGCEYFYENIKHINIDKHVIDLT